MLIALVEHDLHTDADAKHRAPTRESATHYLARPELVEPSHASRERTNSRDNEPARIARSGTVRCHRDIRTSSNECPLDRAQIPAAVVENRHEGHR